MNVKDFDFELPQELIAQDPLEDRSGSKLLVLDKDTWKNRTSDFSGYCILPETGRLSGTQQYQSDSCTFVWSERRNRSPYRDPFVEKKRK